MTHRSGHCRRGTTTGIGVIVLAAVVACLGAAGCSGSARPAADPHAGSGSPGGPRSPSAAASPGVPADGIASTLIPTSGAYLGAFVQPTQYTPPAEIAAVDAFQHLVGPISLVHTYHPWDSPFPNLADRNFVRRGKVLLLTWSGTPDTRKIIAGDYDATITARAEAVKRLGRPILMEFRHEMDRPNLQWAVHGPKDFIAAWDHIRAIFAKVGALNVGWIWCPTGYGFQRGRAQPFYPGNNEVDWVCADIYAPSTGQSLQQAAQPFLRWAKATGKPVMIGEFGVNNDPAGLAEWLLAAGELAGLDKQIKAMAYFDANGIDSNGHPFQDWLGGNKPALTAFADMLRWPEFRPVVAYRA